jgi:UDP-N-acetylmuramoyl-L-alanyl-D-glutamate--2,6-diaminopimelate ligase
MGGRFNVTNAVAAATTARELGVSWDAVAQGLLSAPPVRGRFEAIDEGQPFSVLVDFAHTPAALAEALRAARELAQRGYHPGQAPGPAGQVDGPAGTPSRVIVVLGAGGDRDRGKRPLMGRVASQLADVVVITSDNPRTEKPLAIIEEVASGTQGQQPVVEADRAQAISGAIAMAQGGDVVLIAGKGHETGQDFGTYVAPFDDAEVARDALRAAGHPGSAEGHGHERQRSAESAGSASSDSSSQRQGSPTATGTGVS